MLLKSLGQKRNTKEQQEINWQHFYHWVVFTKLEMELEESVITIKAITTAAIISKFQG